MIKTLSGLRRAFSVLLAGIGEVCQECQKKGVYPDCLGYIWLLPEEARKLYRKGVEIIVINKKTRFINSFVRKDGTIDIGQLKPPCILCKNKRCSIHRTKPLVCKMYPLGFSLKGGTIRIVLYLDCLFSQEKVLDPKFKEQVIALFKRIDLRLLNRILRTYKLVLDISRFPLGPNKVVEIINTGKTGRR